MERGPDRVRRPKNAGRGVDAKEAPSTGARGAILSVEDLELARELEGIEYQPGDILLIRTGFLEWYVEQDLERRSALAPRDRLHGPVAGSGWFGEQP